MADIAEDIVILNVLSLIAASRTRRLLLCDAALITVEAVDGIAIALMMRIRHLAPAFLIDDLENVEIDVAVLHLVQTLNRDIIAVTIELKDAITILSLHVAIPLEQPHHEVKLAIILGVGVLELTILTVILDNHPNHFSFD